MLSKRIFRLSFILGVIVIGAVNLFAKNSGFEWADEVLSFPYDKQVVKEPILQVVHADFSQVKVNKSVLGSQLEIGSKKFEHGLGVWAESYLRLYSPEPITGFSAYIGIDTGPKHTKGRGHVDFIIKSDGKEIFKSKGLTGRDEAQKCGLSFAPLNMLEFIVTNAGENPVMNHSDWAEAEITLQSGKKVRLDQIKMTDIPCQPSRYPFSFTYNDKSSDILLGQWKKSKNSKRLDGYEYKKVQWLSPCGLKLTVEMKKFKDFPAVEWLMWFENTSDKPTGIIENVQSMDIVLNEAISDSRKISPNSYTTKVKDYYTLHRTEGDSRPPHNPRHFLAEMIELNYQHGITMAGASGRPSQKTLPFYKIDTKDGAVIVAVGWSGQWKSVLDSPDGQHLRMQAGLEDCHFKLLPGEKIRLARMLVMNSKGDSWDANAQFRKLIYKHYAATLDNKKPLPSVWANTWCIGRTGLNHSTAKGHMEMIEMFSKIKGVDSFITDAGWYKGGFGTGEGDYVPNLKNWPDGMAPVAASGKKHGIGYGMWYDIEKVYGGTDYAKAHPDWLLSPYATGAKEVTVADDFGRGFKTLKADELKKFTPYLRNLGKPEVVDDLYNHIRKYLAMPGMGAYRQDFNYNPLQNWRLNDSPDRKGITEIKYVMGLYDFWERMAKEFPAVLRDECSSGGKRIDLETVMHMHVHQKCDLSRHPEADQSSIWGLSQYLPNNVFSSIPKYLDDYNFMSAAPASMALGWKVYKKDFDFKRAQKIINIHKRIQSLIIDSWYPLSRPNIDKSLWIASQYHRTDLDKGLIAAYRRSDSVYSMLDVNLREIDADSMYELKYLIAGKKKLVKGADLMSDFGILIKDKPGVEMIIYKKK